MPPANSVQGGFPQALLALPWRRSPRGESNPPTCRLQIGCATIAPLGRGPVPPGGSEGGDARNCQQASIVRGSAEGQDRLLEGFQRTFLVTHQASDLYMKFAEQLRRGAGGGAPAGVWGVPRCILLPLSCRRGVRGDVSAVSKRMNSEQQGARLIRGISETPLLGTQVPAPVTCQEQARAEAC